MIKVELDSIRDNQWNRNLSMWAESRNEIGISVKEASSNTEVWIAVPIHAVVNAISAIQNDFMIYDQLEIPEEKDEK